MHSGFRALRNAMPMNIRGRHPGKGMNEEVAKDIARITTIWAAAKGPFLLGEFSAADAFYAPVATRFVTYDVVLQGPAKVHQEALLECPAVRAWSAEAAAMRRCRQLFWSPVLAGRQMITTGGSVSISSMSAVSTDGLCAI